MHGVRMDRSQPPLEHHGVRLGRILCFLRRLSVHGARNVMDRSQPPLDLEQMSGASSHSSGGGTAQAAVSAGVKEKRGTRVFPQEKNCSLRIRGVPSGSGGFPQSSQNCSL